MYLYNFMNSFILNSSRSSSRSLLTEIMVCYSTSRPFYRATKREKTPHCYAVKNVKNSNKQRSHKTASMNNWNFDFLLLLLS